MDLRPRRPNRYDRGPDRMTEMPGVGLVPNRPRSPSRFVNQRDPEERPRRHDPTYEGSQPALAQRGRRYQPSQEEGSGNPRAKGRDKIPTRAEIERFVPEYHNSMQFLAESFARRKRELRDEVTRQDALSGKGGHENIEYTDRHLFYARDRLRLNSRLSQRRWPEPVRVNQEESEEQPSEVPQDTDESSPPISPPNERAQSASGEVSDNPAECSSRPPGPSPPDPSGGNNSHRGCICPIGLACPNKGDHKIDCRTLVLEWTKWQWLQMRKCAEMLDIRLPPDRPAEEEPFITLQETTPIVRLLDQIPVRGRMTMAIRHTFAKIQDWIRMMQNHSMTEEILNESRVREHLKRFLSDDNKEMRREKAVPEHIVEDLTILYRKWDLGDLGVLARRGLVERGPNRMLFPDPDWKFKRDADYFGHGLLVNGQTWCYRAEMMRDGAHAPIIAGISGSKTQGARSVVMGYHDQGREEYYADVDQGDTIYYYGTALRLKAGDTEPTNLKDAVTHRVERITRNSRGEGPTNATLSLFESYWTGRPVRVFRSWRLAEIVPHRPVSGFRYDGLYIVTAPELVRIERQIYRFKMERMATGQGPLRHSGAPLRPEVHRASRKRRRDGE
ncbi:hypothetical protein AYO21_09617 [Fonsecaea monophora]|uniref:YDG domain-containing protein n=1 Tax=Fonsecaea monophora TaxID=254056 RepID=A0A177EW05_9EURO|nr:hypothetical protein AYO21_09617 [Fonsecaea monophora]OAG36223.1 hypothetical protein AYO21_09617 [Fonsecaea monophora]